MADDVFEHPRLAAIYDDLDPDRSDLDVYAAIPEELGVRRVLDVGCGTGSLAVLLSGRGLEVTGIDPALLPISHLNAVAFDGERWMVGHPGHHSVVVNPGGVGLSARRRLRAREAPSHWGFSQDHAPIDSRGPENHC